MKILQVITDDDRRGAQVFATDLAPALARRGHEVVTVALAPGATRGLHVDVLGSTRLGLDTLRALRSRVRDADVVAAHGSTTLAACAFATTGTRVPFVYRQISDSLFWANTRARRVRVRLLLARAALVLALSSAQGEVLVEHFGVGRDRLRIIPNGVPGARFGPMDDDERARGRTHFGLGRRPVVASVSALVPEKGIDVVIDAVAAVPGAQLVVAGDGPARSGLERAASLRLPGRATFLGSLDDVRTLYAAADVVVLASKGGDSMPAMLIEAGLCAIPAVSTPIGAIEEIVLDGTTGFIVPVGDREALAAALRKVLDDPALGASMGAAARAHCVATFEIDVVAQQWEEALTEARGDDRPPSP